MGYVGSAKIFISHAIEFMYYLLGKLSKYFSEKRLSLRLSFFDRAEILERIWTIQDGISNHFDQFWFNIIQLGSKNLIQSKIERFDYFLDITETYVPRLILKYERVGWVFQDLVFQWKSYFFLLFVKIDDFLIFIFNCFNTLGGWFDSDVRNGESCFVRRCTSNCTFRSYAVRTCKNGNYGFVHFVNFHTTQVTPKRRGRFFFLDPFLYVFHKMTLNALTWFRWHYWWRNIRKPCISRRIHKRVDMSYTLKILSIDTYWQIMEI